MENGVENVRDKYKDVNEFLDSLSDVEIAKLTKECRALRYGGQVARDSKFGDVCSFLDYVAKGNLRNSTAIDLIKDEAVKRFIKNNLN